MNYGRYEIISELGKGAMGVVYKAHDPSIDRTVALKALRQDYAVDEYFVQRFFKEAVAIGRLSHPGIVTVYDVGRAENTIYIAMEFLSGKPLDEVIKEGRMSLEGVVDLGAQVAEALDYAQGKGVVHRDIKPANIILSDDGKTKLTDFGIAHIEDVSATLQTQAGEILGTPVYMSPEQVLGKTPDGRSDLYSLGVILYELVTGRRPFTGKNMAMIFNAVTQEVPPRPETVDVRIPTALSDIIMKCLEKSPEKRFQTGKALAEALGAFKAPPPIVEKSRSTPPTLGKSRRAIVISLGAFVILSVVAWAIWHRMMNPVQPPTPETPEPVQGVLAIQSDPVDATVYINGTLRGKTPLQVDLELGKYEVRLEKPDFFLWEAQISLDKPEKTPLFVKLHPTTF